MDAAHVWTDQQLASLENRMEREYMQAAREMRGKQAKWLKGFEKERIAREKALDNTKEALEAHRKWLSGQAAHGEWLQGMVDGLSASAHQANVRTAQMANDLLPRVFSENANRAAFAVDGIIGRDTGFTLVNEDAVRNLMGIRTEGTDPTQLVKETVWFQTQEGREDLQNVRKRLVEVHGRRIDYAKDIRWNRQKFTSAITQGILQGESIPNIVKRTESIFNQNRSAAVRAARTAVTNAENAGRMSSFERAQRLGIDMEIEWEATMDERTRPTHREVHGEHVKLGERFDNGLRWPGDPTGSPSEVWACRCRMNGRVVGFDGKRGKWVDGARGEQWSRLPDGMTYEQWLAAKPKTPAELRDASGRWVNEADRLSPEWFGWEAAQEGGYATAERIAELEAAAGALDAEVERLSKQSAWIPSEESVADVQALVDKYAAQMAENEWASGFDINALRAESNKLYDEQAKILERKDALETKSWEMRRTAVSDAEWAEYEKVKAEVERLAREYDAYFDKTDEVYRKIDALKDYERASGEHAYFSDMLSNKIAEREAKLAAKAEGERLLAETRLKRNRAYGELSEAQPFAPHVRTVLGDDYADALESLVSAAEMEHPEITACYRRYSSQLRVAEYDKVDGAHYDPSDRGIHFHAERAAAGSKSREKYSTAFHEFGHLIDHVAGYGGGMYSPNWASKFNGLTAVIKKDWERYRNSVGKRLGVKKNKNKAAIQELLDHGAMFDKKKYGAVSDVIEGCTGESYPLGVGHGASYHKSYEGATGVEFFAEVFESAITNQASYNEMKRIFPNAVKMVEDMAREMCQ